MLLDQWSLLKGAPTRSIPRRKPAEPVRGTTTTDVHVEVGWSGRITGGLSDTDLAAASTDTLAGHTNLDISHGASAVTSGRSRPAIDLRHRSTRHHTGPSRRRVEEDDAVVLALL